MFLTTGLSDPREIIASYLVRVAGNISVQPDAPFIDVRGPGPHRVLLEVSSRRAAFHLEAVQVTSGPLEAKINAATNGDYVVDVQVLEQRWNANDRGALGRIAS